MLRICQKFNKTAILSQKIAQHSFRPVLRTFPTTAAKEIDKNKTVGKWLIGCSSMVFGAVVLGGITRLTESGLSMVTWSALGEKRPTNQAEWEAEFQKYQQFPEFKMKNSSMTLEEFKFIFYMEFIHRMWGRAIGAVFLLPAAYFWKKGYFNKRTKGYVSLFGTLIGLQGLMGWYMVKSGLEEERFQDINDVPRVSQYRLASHLGLAFVLYMGFLSQGLKMITPAGQTATAVIKAKGIKRLALITQALVFVTAISGAFVAGLDAGLVYNSFPKMADDWIPKDILAFKPTFKNFTENPTTVQFDHRILGISTLTLISTLWLLSRRVVLPKRTRWAINSIAVMAWTQASLGVVTLLNHVPVPLASMHQSGSLILLSLAVWVTQELKLLRYIPK